MAGKYTEFLSSPSAGTDIKQDIKNRVERIIKTSITRETVQDVIQQVRLHQVADIELKDVIVTENCEIRQDAMVDLFAKTIMKVLERNLLADKTLVDHVTKISNEIEDHSAGLGGLLGNLTYVLIALGVLLLIGAVIFFLLKKRKSDESKSKVEVTAVKK